MEARSFRVSPSLPGATSLSLAIQHHPSRAALLPRLQEGLCGLDVEIVGDPDPEAQPSAWRTYRAALELTPPDVTHRLILQDDALVCQQFGPTLLAAIEAQPDAMLVLCVCGQPKLAAKRVLSSCWDGLSWAILDIHLWVPAIAVVWPVRMIEPALRYVDAQRFPHGMTADDEIIGHIARALGETVLATVPSLVEHDDDVVSLTGRWKHGNPDRRAACFMDAECDPSTIDWSLGPR